MKWTSQQLQPKNLFDYVQVKVMLPVDEDSDEYDQRVPLKK